MPREITSPKKSVMSSVSFDGKHTIQFSESTHRYKLDGKPCAGTTTFIKASYPMSMGLVSWMKTKSLEYLWASLTEPLLVSPESVDTAIRYQVKRGLHFSENERLELFKEARQADKKPAQEAADVGTIIHDYCYLSEAGKKEEVDRLFHQILSLPKAVGEKVMNGVEKFNAWKETNKDELVAAEDLIASPTHMYCGKFDRLARRNGRLVLSDFKTSNGIYVDNFIQLGAYALALREWKNLDVDALEILRFGKDGGEFETLLVDDPNEIKLFIEQAIRCKQTYDFKKLEQDPRWAWRK